jgi:N-acetylneuraminic acid mutarotase
LTSRAAQAFADERNCGIASVGDAAGLPGSNIEAMRFAAVALAAALLPGLAAGAGRNWSRGAPLPVPRGEVAAAQAGGRIYVVGGFTGNGQNSPRVDAYSPTGNRWRRVPDLPLPVDHAMAAGYRGKVYVAGGYGPGRSRLTTLFSSSGGSWTRLAPMPEQRAAGGAAIVDGRLYVVGGVASSTIEGPSQTGRLARTTLVYDIAHDRWSTHRGPTPREHLGVTALGGRIYAIGGRTAGFDTNLNLVEVYNPRTDTWKRLPRVPGKRGGTGAAGFGRWIVSVGGEAPPGTIRTVYGFDVRRRRWLKLPNLPTPRHGLGVVAAGDRVYVIGGGRSPGLSVSSANEFLTIR